MTSHGFFTFTNVPGPFVARNSRKVDEKVASLIVEKQKRKRKKYDVEVCNAEMQRENI